MDMEPLVINVSETFNVYGISAKDIDIWKNICLSVKQYPEEQPIILDFKGVLLVEAWKNKYFTNILRLNNVVLRVYHSSEMKRDVDDICNLCDLGTNRIINIGEVEMVEQVQETGVKRRIIDKLIKNCHVTEHLLTLDFGKALNSLEKADIVLAIKIALTEVLAENPLVDKIKVDFGHVVINENVLDTLFSELKSYIAKYNMEFETVAYKEEFKLHMLKHKGNTVAQKISILQDKLPLDTVVMLTKYVTSKSKDNLGRYGNGVADWCHIAIYRGTEDKHAIFDDFLVADFHTSVHKKEQQLPPTPVKPTRISIPLSALGFWEEFLGSQYHCNYLVQFTPNESICEWVETKQGKAEMQTLTLPEFAKVVLDDNKITYNTEQLQMATEYTNKILSAYVAE